MIRNKLFAVCVSFCTLFIFAGCEDEYSAAVEAAVKDGIVSSEEIKNLKELFAESDGRAVDSISNWSSLINDLMEQNEGMDRRKLEKAIYGLSTKVIVYLDNTYSMKGYAQASDPRSYTSIFEAISTKYSADSVKVSACYVSKDAVAKSIDFNTMCNDLTSHAWAKGDSYTDAYQMDDLFGAVCRMIKQSAENKQDVICFFVSDMIISNENEKIKSNSQTVIHFCERMVTKMTDSLRVLSSNDGKYAAALYKFKAPFGSAEKNKYGRYVNEGIYYKYTNQHLFLHGEERPLYVLAIGSKNVVSEWHEMALKGIQNFAYSKCTFVGGEVVDDIKLNGYSSIDEDKINVNVNESGSEVELELNPASIPSYMTFGDSALCVTMAGKQIDVDDNGKIILGKADDVDEHFLNIKLKDALPRWISDSSSEDDGDLNPEDVKAMDQTFYLKNVFRALVHGLVNSNGQDNLYDKQYTICINNN